MRSDFDVLDLYRALDTQRDERGLSWRQVAGQIWEQSSALNDRRRDHPISPATISGIATRPETSCQHALFMLRWLGASPERFVPDAVGGPRDRPLPDAGPDRRLRWNLETLSRALDAERHERGPTWAELARELGCTQSQLTGLRRVRFATGMRLAMRVTGWLDPPAADFIDAARW